MKSVKRRNDLSKKIEKKLDTEIKKTKKELKDVAASSPSRDQTSSGSSTMTFALRPVYVPCGLVNNGNSSFFNAVLQCLAQTPYLSEVLKESVEPGAKIELSGGQLTLTDGSVVNLPPISCTFPDEDDNCTSSLAYTIDILRAGGRFFNPLMLFRQVITKWPEFCGDGYTDAHELLSRLLENVRCEDLRRYQSVILGSLGVSSKVDPETVEGDMKLMFKFYEKQAEDKILKPERVFGIILKSFTVCHRCYYASSHNECVLDISLPLPSNFNEEKNHDDSGHCNSYWIDQTYIYFRMIPCPLANYDKLSDVDKNLIVFTGSRSDKKKVVCEDCTRRLSGKDGGTVYTTTMKQVFISSPPPVLVLHSQQFKYICGELKIRSDPCGSFPIVLDIAPFCTSEVNNLPNVNQRQRKLLYSLYGMVVLVNYDSPYIRGRTDWHHVAYVRMRPHMTPENERWKFLPRNSKTELFANSAKKKFVGKNEEPSICGNVRPQGKWLMLDDIYVKEVTENEILKVKPYILFYERIY